LWRPVPAGAAAFDCGHRHDPGRGRLDESARRLSHEELAAATVLAGEGHRVVSLADLGRAGRHPDLEVCGWPVEVKAFVSAEFRRQVPTPQSVFNKLARAAGQSPHVVLFGVGSGLTPATVRRGLARYGAGDRAVPPLSSVRVLGDGFDLAWTCRPARQLQRAPSLGAGL
jgi:hypothetical protein